MPLPTEGTCRSCGAPLLWAITEAGKKAPLDRALTIIVPVTTNEAGALLALSPVRGHVNHFATCPDRDRHRKEKR